MGLGIFAIILGIFGFALSGLLGILGLAISANCLVKSTTLKHTPDLTEEEFQTDKKTLKGLGIVGLLINGLTVIWLLVRMYIF